MELSGLTRWSVDELAVLYTLQACLDATDYAALSAGVISWSVCFLTSALQAVEHVWRCIRECGERVCVLCACVNVRLYVFMCMCLSLCVCVCVCVCASDCVRACVCIKVRGVCVRVCVVKSWRPGLRSVCVCVCDNFKPCRLESTPGRAKRERTPTRVHTRLSPLPPRATRG